jgi:hypothetical protein
LVAFLPAVRDFAVSETDLREFVEAMTKLRAVNTASPEKAREFLKEEGFLTDDGRISPRYTPDRRPDRR